MLRTICVSLVLLLLIPIAGPSDISAEKSQMKEDSVEEIVLLLNSKDQDWEWNQLTSVDLLSDGVVVGGSICTTENCSATFAGEIFDGIGYDDGIIASISLDGELRWGNSFGSSLRDNVNMVQASSDDTIWVAGTFCSDYFLQGTTIPNEPCIFNLGESELISRGSADGFVTRLDSDGEVLWSIGIGGEEFDSIISIDERSTGALLVSGWLGAPFVGDEGKCSQEEWGNFTNRGFVAEISRQGELSWMRVVGGEGNSSFTSVKSTYDNRSFIMAGWFNGNLTGLEDECGVVVDEWIIPNGTQGQELMFFAMNSENNSFRYSSPRGTGDDQYIDIALTEDSVYIVGTLSSDLSNSGIGSSHIGERDAFILSMDRDYQRKWGRVFGSTTDDDLGLSVDVYGDRIHVSVQGCISGGMNCTMYDDSGQEVYFSPEPLPNGGTHSIDARAVVFSLNEAGENVSIIRLNSGMDELISEMRHHDSGFIAVGQLGYGVLQVEARFGTTNVTLTDQGQGFLWIHKEVELEQEGTVQSSEDESLDVTMIQAASIVLGVILIIPFLLSFVQYRSFHIFIERIPFAAMITKRGSRWKTVRGEMTRTRIMEILHSMDDPISLKGLAKLADISRSVARHHIGILVADGKVEIEMESPTSSWSISAMES